MQIDKRRLAELTDEVDQMHHEGMRTIREDLGEVHFGELSEQLGDSRRSFIKKATLTGALVTVGTSVLPVARFAPAAWAQGQELDDEAIARFAMGVEYAAAEAYQAAIDGGRLSEAVTEVARTFRGHHAEHGDAFFELLHLEEGEPKEPNQELLVQVGSQIRDAADEAAVLEIAYQLEEAAAATYLFSLGALQDRFNAGLVGRILPIESQHAVVIGTVLGKPVTDTVPAFQNDDAALDPAEYAG